MAIILIFWGEWLSHLPWDVIVIVWRWWNQASWMNWVDLSIVIGRTWPLVCVVNVSDVVGIILVFWGQGLLELPWNVIVIVWWRRHQSSWVSGVDLGIVV